MKIEKKGKKSDLREKNKKKWGRLQGKEKEEEMRVRGKK